MARSHLKKMMAQDDAPRIAATCEPSDGSLRKGTKFLNELGVEPPPNIPDLAQLLEEYKGGLDAAMIATPPMRFTMIRQRAVWRPVSTCFWKNPWS